MPNACVSRPLKPKLLVTFCVLKTYNRVQNYVKNFMLDAYDMKINMIAL